MCLSPVILPWSHFHPLSSGIARKGHTSVSAEESSGFPAHKLTKRVQQDLLSTGENQDLLSSSQAPYLDIISTASTLAPLIQ